MGKAFKSGFFGEVQFKAGQRVRPSKDGNAAHLFPKTRQNQTGLVTKVDKFNCPTVLWEGRKTPKDYHPRFIALDRRRKTPTPTRGGAHD